MEESRCAVRGRSGGWRSRARRRRRRWWRRRAARIRSILFFYARPCGTTDWGPDLFGTDDPIEGTIQPGGAMDFTVEAGCYDLRADHLATLEPGPLVTKSVSNQLAAVTPPLVWTVQEEDPVDPT